MSPAIIESTAHSESTSLNPKAVKVSTPGNDLSTMPAQTARLPVKFQRLVDTARMPTRGSPLSAGHDLYASVACHVPPRSQVKVPTGLKMALPADCYGRIAPRSGLAAKNCIDVMAGVVDADYRGELLVILRNHSESEAFEVSVGDRIAQLICERIYHVDFEEVASGEQLPESQRGEGGFGSTGKN